jgi:hypothetical protein
MTWPPTQEHEDRAQEFEALGRLRWAHLVRECGKRIGPKTVFRCGVRCCPTCAHAKARYYSGVLTQRIKSMAFPILTEFKVMTRSVRDLGPSMDLLREALTLIRRRRCLSSIPSAVGAFHASPMKNAPIWTTHNHVVMDIVNLVEEDDDLDEWERTVDAEFRRLTAGRGRFSIAPEPDVDTPERMARYICKPETCAPPPGAYSLGQLEVLLVALHGRQLLIHWGSTARGRRFRSAA